MPVNRRNWNAAKEDFLSLSMIGKPSKRAMEDVNDSIGVAKKQKRCKVKNPRKENVTNLNNVSINSNHNDGIEDEEVVGNIVDEVDIVDFEDQDDEVVDTREKSISEEIEFVGGEIALGFEK